MKIQWDPNVSACHGKSSTDFARVSACHGKSANDFGRVSACHGKSSEDLARVSTCHGKSSKDFAAVSRVTKNMKHFLCAFVCIYHSLIRWVIYVENFEFLNVAKFLTLARLIIRYSIRELLQNVNIFMLRKRFSSFESSSEKIFLMKIFSSLAFGIEGLSNFGFEWYDINFI